MNATDENSNLFVYHGAIPNSPTEKSDLRIGDKILSLNGVTLMDLDDLNKGIEKDPSKRVVEVLRGNSILIIEIDMFNIKPSSNEVNYN